MKKRSRPDNADGSFTHPAIIKKRKTSESSDSDNPAEPLVRHPALISKAGKQNRVRPSESVHNTASGNAGQQDSDKVKHNVSNDSASAETSGDISNLKSDNGFAPSASDKVNKLVQKQMRKRYKTRSKQKNIKRDTRPVEKRPGGSEYIGSILRREVEQQAKRTASAAEDHSGSDQPPNSGE